MTTDNRLSPEKELVFIESLDNDELIKMFDFIVKQLKQVNGTLNLVKQQVIRRGLQNNIKGKN